MKPESKVSRCHTNTRRGKALVANEETTRFTRGLSSLFSLLLKSFFSFVFGGTYTLCVFVCMMGPRTLLLYGALALFLCFGGFFSHYVSVSSLLLSCHTSF